MTIEKLARDLLTLIGLAAAICAWIYFQQNPAADAVAIFAILVVVIVSIYRIVHFIMMDRKDEVGRGKED